MKVVAIIPVCFLLIPSVLCRNVFNPYPQLKVKNVTGYVGEPVILTTLIKEGKIDAAKEASQVELEELQKLNVESYAGYFTVDETFNSNLFFWFFPAKEDYANAPVILWLQGGPGASSLYGLFAEHGPVKVNAKGNLEAREYAWSNQHSVIYIDNPVGTGFSFTNNGFAQNETKVGEDLYNALLQFFQVFPELQQNDFFVTGESYAGKYVPAVSYTIYKNNKDAEQKINLKGLAIGNGLCDPKNMMVYSSYLYQIGLIDENGRDEFAQYEEGIVRAINNGNFKEAYNLFDQVINGDLTEGPALYKNITGFSNYFNYLYPVEEDEGDYSSFVQSESVRKAIHVGSSTYNSGVDVEKNLINDVMDSVAPWLEELINNYRVLIFNGQLDIIVAYPLTANYLKSLTFNGSDDYKNASRIIWKVDGDIAGYGKKAGKLTSVVVRNAGHMVALDQPKWGHELIYNFTRNTLFETNVPEDNGAVSLKLSLFGIIAVIIKLFIF